MKSWGAGNISAATTKSLATTMTIKTYFDYPPIPIRSFDWSAIDYDTYDGTPGCPIGRGETEAAAVTDLLEQLAEGNE